MCVRLRTRPVTATECLPHAHSRTHSFTHSHSQDHSGCKREREFERQETIGSERERGREREREREGEGAFEERFSIWACLALVAFAFAVVFFHRSRHAAEKKQVERIERGR